MTEPTSGINPIANATTKRSMRALLDGCVVLACLLFCEPGPKITRGQEPEFAAIPNSEFIGKKSVGRVTPIFEIYDPHSVEDLQTVQNMGFDQVILDRAPLHREATNLGLRVVLANWWTPETEQDVIDSMLKLAREVEPGYLAGISVMDEPERNSPDTPFSFYVDLYQKLKPQLTGALDRIPLEISYWGPLVSWDQRYYEYFSYLYEASDVMRLMPYPDLHEDPLADVYLMMQRSKRAMALAKVDIPHVVILQTWILPPENKLPEINELRVMAYQVLLGGAEVLSFFEYKPETWEQTPGFTEKFKQLMAELVVLRTRLAGAEIETVLDENLILTATASWPDGRSEKLRVNTNREPTEGLAALAIESTLSPHNTPQSPSSTLAGNLAGNLGQSDQWCESSALNRPQVSSRCVEHASGTAIFTTRNCNQTAIRPCIKQPVTMKIYRRTKCRQIFRNNGCFNRTPQTQRRRLWQR